MAEKSNHYVDNKDMLKEIKKITFWNELQEIKGVRKAKAMIVSVSGEYGWDYVQDMLALSGAISDKLGDYILKIAMGVSHKSGYMNYSCKEDMIGDACYIMTKYIDRFDYRKSTKPFAYFSKVTHHAFEVRRKKEESQRQCIQNYQEKNYPDLMKDMCDGNAYLNFDLPNRNDLHEIDDLINSTGE